MTPRIRQLAAIDQQLFRYALAYTLAAGAVVLMLTLTGCVYELKLIPQCEGSPAVSYPCLAACKVKVFASKIPTEQLIPNALVIEDHLGIPRCMAVS